MFMLTAQQAAAQADDDHELLLKFEQKYGVVGGLCSRFDTEVLIARNGLVVSQSLSEGGQQSYSRRRAPQEVFLDLVQALRDHRVGFALGDCSFGEAPPQIVLETTVTWYGNYPRKRTFGYTLTGQPPCPPETQALAEALLEFFRRMGPPDAARTCLVPVTAPCTRPDEDDSLFCP